MGVYFVDIGGDTIRFVPDETGTASDSGNSSFGKPDIGICVGCEFSVLQAADHVAIANKRINSFLEEVRYNYKLRTEELDSSFIDLLSERSGVARGSVEGLIFLIIRIRKTEHVDEDQLRELVRYIELFKTKS